MEGSVTLLYITVICVMATSMKYQVKRSKEDCGNTLSGKCTSAKYALPHKDWVSEADGWLDVASLPSGGVR